MRRGTVNRQRTSSEMFSLVRAGWTLKRHTEDIIRQIWLYMAVSSAGEQINYRIHILHLRASYRPLFFFTLGGE